MCFKQLCSLIFLHLRARTIDYWYALFIPADHSTLCFKRMYKIALTRLIRGGTFSSFLPGSASTASMTTDGGDDATLLNEDDEPDSHDVSIDSPPSELLFEIAHLRGRLERRNFVLDAVRRAYHLDVHLVKERIRKVHGHDDLLASVPSLDLRPALKLFSPEECEMRLRPCAACGGHLEIVHRESARITRLKQTCQTLQDNEQKIRLELMETERRAGLDRKALVELKERVEGDSQVFIEKINALKRWILGYDELKKEHAELQIKYTEAVGETRNYRQDLIVLRETQTRLARATTEFETQKVCAKEDHDVLRELRRSNEELRQSEAAWKRTSHQTSSMAWFMKGELAHNSIQKRELARQLSKRKMMLAESNERLCKVETQIAEMKLSERALTKEYTNYRNEALSEQNQAKQIVKELSSDLRSKEEKLFIYRHGVHESIKLIRRTNTGQDNGEVVHASGSNDTDSLLLSALNEDTTALRDRVESLKEFGVAYAKCLYNHCIAQETLLKKQGYPLDRAEGKCRQGKVGSILRQLDRGNEHGSCIDWNEILEYEADRRHLLARLGNRMQIGTYSIENMSAMRHDKHEAATKRLCREHETEMNKVVRHFEKHFEGFERSLQQKLERIEVVENHLAESRMKVASMTLDREQTKCDVEKLERRNREECKRASGLRDKLNSSVMETSILKHTVGKKEGALLRMQSVVVEGKRDAEDTNKMIAQLEALLEKTTGRYAAVLKRERYLLATNRSVGIQARPAVASVNIQAKIFIPPRCPRRLFCRVPIECHSKHMALPVCFQSKR